MTRRRRSRPLDPAGRIIRQLGGPIIVSKITRTAATAPYRWGYSRKIGGTGGLIPQRYHARLLRYARRSKIELVPADFLPRRALRE